MNRLADEDVPTCESCGALADWRLADGSTWCSGCHGAALRSGYDTDGGTFIGPDPARAHL